ncbi:hypothetical protein BJ912DRAFT_390147 [Pholiota molesta]|nr:hypothetical protein BJ912DRAFT_390147 [Pholiota molesta]
MFLAATIHCFQEISASIWTDIPRNGDSHLEGKVRHNNYFEQLLQLGMPSCSVPMYIFRRASYETHGNKELTTIQQTYKQEQMLYFLVLICQPNPSPQISQYQLELWLHIISEVQKLPLPSGSHSQIPMLLDPGTFHCIYFGHPLGVQDLQL